MHVASLGVPLALSPLTNACIFFLNHRIPQEAHRGRENVGELSGGSGKVIEPCIRKRAGTREGNSCYAMLFAAALLYT